MAEKLTLIKNALIPDDGKKSFVPSDILISPSKGKTLIKETGRDLSSISADTVIDADGLCVMPAATDLCCSLCDPGFTAREDLGSGSRAAVAGGFSRLVAMPVTNPAPDDPDTFEYIKRRAAQIGSPEIIVAASPTKGAGITELSDIEALAAAGAEIVADISSRLRSFGMIREVMRLCAGCGITLILRADEPSISSGGVVNLGRISNVLSLGGIPRTSESIGTAAILLLCRETGCKVHITSVTTAESIALIAEAKRDGANVSCDTCPPYFSLCEDDILYLGTAAKLMPPLRLRSDVEAVKEGLRNGTIDCISSGHMPVTAREKLGTVTDAEFGVSSLETVIPAAVTYLVDQNVTDMYGLYRLLCKIPAEIVGRPCRLEAGSVCDIIGIDAQRERIVREDRFIAKCKSSPFMGMQLCGSVEFAVVGGKLTRNEYQNREPRQNF